MGNSQERTLITLLMSPADKNLLEQLTENDGGGGMSAFVRRMIRQEARRQGMAVTGASAQEATPAGQLALQER